MLKKMQKDIGMTQKKRGFDLKQTKS